MNISFIEIKNLTFSYGDNPIFKEFCAAFRAGDSSAVMAQSGTGKTTLLHILAGLLQPMGGTIIYPMKNPRFSIVFQENRLLEHASVSKNLRLVNPGLSANQITAALSEAGLPDTFLHKKIRQLSGGEKRRIAIIRALLADYDILLLDEPFTGLDGDTKETMMRYTRACTHEKTVLLVTHDEGETEALHCNQLLRL